MQHTIFISYASADEKVAASICDALEQRGFQCWIAYRDVRGGKNYQAVIPSAIRSAKVMVLVFSAHTNASHEVEKELALASKWKLHLIPLRVEDVEPEPAFLYELVTRQWIDYFKDREQSLRLLGDEIGGIISPQPGELPNPSPRALGKPVSESAQWKTSFRKFSRPLSPAWRTKVVGRIALAVLVVAAAGSIWVANSDRATNQLASIGDLQTTALESGASKQSPESPQSVALLPEAPVDPRKEATPTKSEKPPVSDGEPITGSSGLKRRSESPQSAVPSPESAPVPRADLDKPTEVVSEAIVVLRHEDDVNSAAFSPDGTRIVTASDDQTARVWDAATGKPIAVLVGHSWLVQSAAFSPDGTRIVTASLDGTARVWDAATGKLISVLRLQSFGASAAFSPDGTRVVTGSSTSSTARIWDATTGEPITALSGHDDVIWSVAFSPDGARIVTASSDKTARIWDAATAKLVTILKGDPDDRTDRVDEATGKLISVRRFHTDKVTTAAFSPDGTRVVTASFDRTALVWDAVTGKVIAVLSDAYHAAFSLDGTRIVTFGGAGAIQVWDAAATSKVVAVLRSPANVNSGAFSPDGTRIVTAHPGNTARVWLAP